jgi:acetyltransferase-like isoleucine patch superfamily enzyme
MLVPVVIFVYNRPEHTKKTIESLAKNHLAHETEVYIYADATKNEKVIEKVKEVRKYIDSLQNNKYFKSIEIKKAESNKGLANSVISGVNKVIEKYGKVIVVEDDLVSSPDFLQYMNAALDYYEKDDEIWSISGYTFNIDIPKDYNSDVYLSYRGCSWGWASWRDRWEKVDWDISDYNNFKTNKKLRKKFNRGGRDMANMLDLQMQGKIDSWAIRWCYAQSKLDMLTVYPIVSRIRNIGLDGMGTHSGITLKFDVILNDGNNRYEFETVELDKRIVKSFRDQFGTSFDYFVIGLKTYIKRLLGM